MRILVAALSVCACVSLGCAPLSLRAPLDYTTVEQNPVRNPERARQYHARAIAKLDAGDVAEAEQLLQRALIEDVSHGPSHNALGLLYFQAGKLYLAAWEFEYAMQVMPERGEPYNNLGLVYEAVKKFDDAIFHYENAVAMSPQQIEFVSNLARAKVRRGDIDDETLELLDQVASFDDRPTWRKWALEQLEVRHTGRRGHPETWIDPPSDEAGDSGPELVEPLPEPILGQTPDSRLPLIFPQRPEQ